MHKLGYWSFAVLVVAVAIPGLVPAAQAQDAAGDVSGTWKWSQQGPGGEIEFTLKIKQVGEKLTGTITGFGGEESPIEEGKVKDGTVTFKVTRDFGGRPFVTTYTGKVDGNALKGKSETVFTMEFQAKRSQ